jgi:hypothetical protein
MPFVAMSSVMRQISAGKAIGISVVAGILLIVIARGFSGSAGSGAKDAGGRAYYSDDDGETTFVDDAMKQSPFNHNGKEAVRVLMFRCGGTTFIGYMERYSKESLAAIEKAKHDPNFELTMLKGIQPDVKKPKQGTWVGENSPEGQSIVDVKCPDGKDGPVERVVP